MNPTSSLSPQYVNKHKFCTYFELVKQGYSFEPYLDALAHSPFLLALARRDRRSYSSYIIWLLAEV